jgi:hypothetical protein
MCVCECVRVFMMVMASKKTPADLKKILGTLVIKKNIFSVHDKSESVFG